MQDTILDGGTSILKARNASRAERSLSLRKRPEIQEMPRRSHRGSTRGYEGMRKLHRLLRRLGRRDHLPPRHEARDAMRFPGGRLLPDLRARAGGAVPQLRVRLA